MSKKKKKVEKPPLGVLPLHLWEDHYPEPTVQQLIGRHADVSAALQRYREAGVEGPREQWLAELGLDFA